MPIAPIFASPCDLANRLPTMIAEFLDIENSLKRRFREDSITDILVASMLSLPGNDVIVQTPNEVKTGGDFDLAIVDPLVGDSVQFRIQAKRLTPHAGNWALGSYRELAYPHNSGNQSRLLMAGVGRETIPTIPLYAFYNPARTCTASGAIIGGIELASAVDIRDRIKMMVRVKPKRLPFKRIGSLQPLFFPLADILCAPSSDVGTRTMASPRDVRRTIESAIETRSGRYGRHELEGETRGAVADQRPRAPLRVLDSLPANVRQAVERRAQRIIPARVKRPRIILISEAR
ncbi:DUF6615 family protein [Sphingomonas glacialis]|nr:DUF6615 family protein [Sphingomonas glacialis]